MNQLANEDNIFSSKTKKLKKQIAYKPYWDNTHPIQNAEEDSSNEEDDKKQTGYALLRKVYGGNRSLISPNVQKKLSKNYNRVVDNYSDVVRHLEEHQSEGVGDPQDVKQSKYLRGEIKRINALHLTPANKVAGKDILYQYSNPKTVQRKAFQLYGKNAIVYKSDKKDKKYMIQDENTGKFVYFGQLKPPYEDFTKSLDEEKRYRYLTRASNIKGDWKNNIYSPNFLSMVLLWM